MDTQPPVYLGTDEVELVYRNLLIGGEPGGGKSSPWNLPALRELEGGSICLACPPGCAECSGDESTCECYEHAHLHPDNQPDTGEGVG
jgi:hypothetical protein